MEVTLFIAALETLGMSLGALFFAVLLGTPLGLYLYLHEKTLTYRSISFITNLVRAIPFVILLIALIPFTRFIVGSSIGPIAATVPLAIAATPLFARFVESALMNTARELFELRAVLNLPARTFIRTVLLREQLPALIHGATSLAIQLVGYSAMAGLTGGGGLGALAYTQGYLRFNLPLVLATIGALLILVYGIQYVGTRLAVAFNHKH